MDPLFQYIFGALVIVCLILRYTQSSSDATETSPAFKKFQNNYLLVYLIMMASDWLQGPFVYKLYETYGFSMGEIATLFIAGFGSSMLFGTFVGSMADKYGRKLNCMLFGIIYAVSCATKHFNNFHILMFGRLTGGIATSILYSAFESWLVYEHHKGGFEDPWLGNTFSKAIFGNGIVAIVSGIVAQYVVDMTGSYTAPFDLSLTLLLVGTAVIWKTWSENFGDSSASMNAGLADATKLIFSDRKVLMCGAIQGLFEGAMYTFVFMWTPFLGAKITDIPHGLVFASFMVSVMIGSTIFGMLMNFTRPESFTRVVFLVAAASLYCAVIVEDPWITLLSFCVFEGTVGIYWPSLGMQRSKYIPESSRSTIMTFFRVPLNFLVVFILYEAENIAPQTIFMICVVWLAIAAVCQHVLHKATLEPATAPSATESSKNK